MNRILTIIATLLVICTIFLGAIAFKAVQGDINTINQERIARQEQRQAEKQAEVQATIIAESIPFCVSLKTLESESTNCAVPEDGVVELSLPAPQGQTVDVELDLQDNTAKVEIISPGVFPPSEPAVN